MLKSFLFLKGGFLFGGRIIDSDCYLLNCRDVACPDFMLLT
jgi:hypothetical protein